MGAWVPGASAPACSPQTPPPFSPPGAQAPDGSQEGGADAPRRRARRGGAEPREDDTLAAPDALRMKALDGSFMVDPLFHRMSQIFDEDGAQGAPRLGAAGSASGLPACMYACVHGMLACMQQSRTARWRNHVCQAATWAALTHRPSGMLLLNRGVCGGSAIMFESNGVPEDEFPLPASHGGGSAASPMWRGADATVRRAPHVQ